LTRRATQDYSSNIPKPCLLLARTQALLAASSIGILLVPMLYVMVQRMRESTKSRFGGKANAPAPSAH